MEKPCRLELNNSGAWKLLGRFDAADEETADEIMNSAESLAKALGGCTLRISTDDAYPSTLMRWKSAEEGWRDTAGEPA